MLAIVCINLYRLTLADASCTNCLEALVGLNDSSRSIVLTDEVLQREYRRIDRWLLYDAFDIIGRHLKRSIDNIDVDSNLQEVRALIRIELADKSVAPSEDRRNAVSRWLDRRRCLSQQLPSKSRNVMINALMRLLNLEATTAVDQPGKTCGSSVTEKLAECNLIARDPIGRRLRGQSLLVLPRIDDIIYEAALHKAQSCIDQYRSELTPLYPDESRPDLPANAVHDYWSLILKRRFKAPFHDRTVDKIFQHHSKRALDLVEKMQYAIEDDEAVITRDFVDKASTKSGLSRLGMKARLLWALLDPCRFFVTSAKPKFDSMDFDLQFERSINPQFMQAFWRDGIVHRTKAYYLLCSKLLDQTDRAISLVMAQNWTP